MVERSSGLQENLSSREYSLRDGVFFVSGAFRGAIYDTNLGKVYSINKSGCDILTGKIDDKEYWKKLEPLELTTRNIPEKKSDISELLQKPSLQFVWFEIISDDCNERCIHCYADSMPPSYRKSMGISIGGFIDSEQTPQEMKKKLTFEEWKKLINDSYLLGCKKCQFIGGEPFLYRGDKNETVFDLAKHARNIGFDFIEIFTNGTLLTEEKINIIKNLKLNIAISLYSSDEKVQDSITRTPGSFKKTTRALELLKEANIPTRVETVLMQSNEKTIEATQEYIDNLGFSHHQPDVLRPKGRGENAIIIPSEKSLVNYGLMTSPNYSINKETLSRNVSGHSCLFGKITITDNGDVLPCIFSRNMPVGNLFLSSLQEIITGQKLETIWRSTKDNVLVCQDCEYRYVCFDCRPISEEINKGNGEYLSTPYPRCTYNPYSGEWANGVWKVDENGKAYYDMALKPIINEVLTQRKIEPIQTTSN